jgi:hypothetical protein
MGAIELSSSFITKLPHSLYKPISRFLQTYNLILEYSLRQQVVAPFAREEGNRNLRPTVSQRPSLFISKTRAPDQVTELCEMGNKIKYLLQKWRRFEQRWRSRKKSGCYRRLRRSLLGEHGEHPQVGR